MRSNYEVASSIRASALIGLLSIDILACADARESPMRADPAPDSGAPAESVMSCVDDKCEAPQLDDRWLCPVDSMSVHTDTVRYSVRVVDFVSGMPRQDLKVKACSSNDLSCEKPVATFVDSKQTGKVQLDLPTGFLGFLELTSDAVDTLLYVTKPIVENTSDRDITVPTLETIDLLASLLEYTWDMDKGLVVLEVLDCSEQPQSGIHFACHEGGDGFYMVNGIPFKSEQTTMYDPMNNTAEGGFINVPPGLAEFSAQLGSEADATRLGTLKVQIRARTLTIIELHP